MESRFCPSCKKPSPKPGIYCGHCGAAFDQQSFELQPSLSIQQARFQPSHVAAISAFSQPVVQQTIAQVLRCADCRLLNFYGEEICKRCGGMLVDRNFADTRNQQNQNSAHYDPSTSDDQFTTLKTAEKNIHNAWMAGVVSASLTVMLVLGRGMASARTEEVAYPALAALITFLLSYGIYKKSTGCAILLCGLFAVDKLIFFINGGNLIALPVSLIFLLFYAKGISGTYEYHKLTAGDTSLVYDMPSGQQRAY